MDRIKALLDEKVRPLLRVHGGDIEVLSVEKGVLRFRLLGHCAGCPSASLTTERFIAETVCKAFDEITDVVSINAVSDDLLEQAKKILSAVHCSQT